MNAGLLTIGNNPDKDGRRLGDCAIVWQRAGEGIRTTRSDKVRGSQHLSRVPESHRLHLCRRLSQAADPLLEHVGRLQLHDDHRWLFKRPLPGNM